MAGVLVDDLWEFLSYLVIVNDWRDGKRDWGKRGNLMMFGMRG